MGNDGGSIPKRRELVKEAARDPTSSQLKETIQEQQEYLWTTDPISNKPLRTPIVSGCTGTLYNKDAILEFLLPSEGAEFQKAETEKRLAGTVKSLRDVVEVKFESESTDPNRWICPITNKPLGAKTKAVYLVPCGHAFSAAAIKEVADGKCLQCSEPYEQSNIIPILPTAENAFRQLEIRIASLKEKGLTHSLKKASGSKKRKKNGDKEAQANGLRESISLKSNNDAATAQPASIKNSSTASLTARVLEEQEDRNKKRKLQRNDNLNSLFSAKEKANALAKRDDFMTRGFSIPSKKS